jgi:hypothetical protein
VLRGFACATPYTLTPGQPPPGLDYLPASPHRSPTTSLGRRLHHSPSSEDSRAASRAQHHRVRRWRFKAGTGISTRCPSTTPVGLALGPDLPWADQLDPGTLGQSAQEFPTLVSLLMPAFSLVNRPRLASAAASPGTRRSPTHHNTRWGYTLQ